ncbi:MAG TPA: ABC transporter permease [Terracidiphilus sp.]|nr:ABC transporter permease [Terracidiphilus sp.]
MTKLIFANLLHRPLRSVISVLAVAIEVVMILSIVAIFMGMLNDQKERTNGIGADLMMRPSHASIMNGISGAPIPIKDEQAVERLPHVAIVSPAITLFNTASDDFGVIYGIDYQSFNALRPFEFLQGGPFQGPNDVIVDDVFAGKKHYLGETIKVMDRPFRICGIVEAGKGGRKMIPIDTMGDLMGAEGRASLFYIKADNPANDQAIIDEIHAVRGLEDFPVQTMEEWLSLMTPQNLPGFNQALGIVTGIAVIIGFLVIFQSMYTAVLERTREIGILKSMGASKLTIISVVLRECAVLAVAGVGIGIAGTYAVQLAMGHFFPTTHFEITGQWILRAALIAFTGSICGALYPGWMAARKDPIEALAYE